MAHNLETNGNDVAFALRGKPAWHNLANRIFNITNGEIFALRDLWPQIADALGIEPGEDRIQNFASAMPPRAGNRDIGEAAFLLEAGEAAFVERAL